MVQDGPEPRKEPLAGATLEVGGLEGSNGGIVFVNLVFVRDRRRRRLLLLLSGSSAVDGLWF